MQLYSRQVGEALHASGAPKETLLLLHGLFGSADNLGGIARLLQEQYRVIAIDHRNHGRSPHSDVMNYGVMAEDIAAFMDDEHIESAFVFGHSMGGKVAMQLALNKASRVKKLIVADIAPVTYDRHHDGILQGMLSVAEAAPGSRKAAMEQLADFVSEPDVLNFLMTNWRRNDSGDWGWRVNLKIISEQYAHIAAGNTGSPYMGDTLFLRGGASDYIRPEHREATLQLFPNATVRTIEGASHWLHAEKPDMVARAILKFLQ